MVEPSMAPQPYTPMVPMWTMWHLGLNFIMASRMLRVDWVLLVQVSPTVSTFFMEQGADFCSARWTIESGLNSWKAAKNPSLSAAISIFLKPMVRPVSSVHLLSLSSMVLMGLMLLYPFFSSMVRRARLSIISTVCPSLDSFMDSGHPMNPSPPATIIFISNKLFLYIGTYNSPIQLPNSPLVPVQFQKPSPHPPLPLSSEGTPLNSI